MVAPVIERTALLELMTQMIAPALEAKVQLECFVQGAAQKNFLLIQVLRSLPCSVVLFFITALSLI